MSRHEVDSSYFRCCGVDVRTGARIMSCLDGILLLMAGLFILIGQVSGYIQLCLWIHVAIMIKFALIMGFLRGLRQERHCLTIPYAITKTIHAFLALACTGLCVIAVVVAAQNMEELSGGRHSGLRRHKRETDWESMRLPTPPSTLPPPPFQYPADSSEYTYEEAEDYDEETPEPPIYPDDLTETMEAKDAKPLPPIDVIRPLDYPAFVDPMHSSYQEEERLRKLMLENNDAFLSPDSDSEEEGSKSDSDGGDYYPLSDEDMLEEEPSDQSETGMETLEEEEAEAEEAVEEIAEAFEEKGRELYVELVKGAREVQERDQWLSEPPLQLDGQKALHLDGAEAKVVVPEMPKAPLLRESVYERYPYVSGMLLLVRTHGMWALVGLLLLHILFSALLFTHAHLIVRTACLIRLMRKKAAKALLADPEPIAVVGTKEMPKVHGIPIAFPAK